MKILRKPIVNAAIISIVTAFYSLVFIAGIHTFDEWRSVWNDLGKLSEQKSEFLRASYCFRMAEFFMKSDDSEKELLYQKCIEYFYKAFDIELQFDYEK